MAKKVWTAAARKAFAAKMKRARVAARGRRKNPTKAKLRIAHITDYSRGGQGFTALVRGKKVIGRYTNMADAQAAYKRARARRKNPTKEQVKAAAKKMAAGAARLAWRGAKLTGRAGKAGAKAAAAEVKASICRPRAANPHRRRRRRNPASGFVIVVRPKNLGGAEHSRVWDGKKFSRGAPVIYPTRQAAVSAGQDLYELRKIKRGWRAWVGDVAGSYLSA